MSYREYTRRIYRALNSQDALQELYQRVAPHYLPRLMQHVEKLIEQRTLMDVDRNRLRYHQRRLDALEIWSAMLGGVFYGLLVAVLWLRDRIRFPEGVLLTIAIAYALFMTIFLMHSLFCRLISRRFAESIAIGALVYSLKLLDDEGILSTMRGKEHVQRYLHLAASRTAQLAHQLGRMAHHLPGTVRTREDARICLERVAAYLYEHEIWILTPQDSTVPSLRRDLSALLPIYLSGDYHEFRKIVPEVGRPDNSAKGLPSLKELVGYTVAIGVGFAFTVVWKHEIPLLLILILTFRMIERMTGAGIVELFKHAMGKS
ncbi:MAG TPA: hypothetical protein VNL77_07870 [Roseiflexaceae bacterium]|nr:hypothetical protein [Roseiflexaceae bacterium]